MPTNLTVEKVVNGDDDLYKLFSTVPLGMSKFQIQRMVVSKPGGDTRSVRQAIIELHSKFAALKEAEFRRKRMRVKKRKIEAQLAPSGPLSVNDEFEREILQIDLEELEHQEKMENILINDAMMVVGFLLQSLSTLPAITREIFENGEPEYWQKEFILQARREVLQTGSVSVGTLEAMENIGMNPVQVAADVRIQVEVASQEYLAIRRDEAEKRLQELKTMENGPKEINGG